MTAIVAYDTLFYEHLPRLFLHTDARAWFTSNEALATETAFRNSSLQGAYFILALRAHGLDCGPMSGFNPQAVDAAFFADGRCRTNFLLNRLATAIATRCIRDCLGSTSMRSPAGND